MNLPYNGLYRPVELLIENQSDTYLDLARGQRKLWNMRVKETSRVISTLTTDPKCFKWVEVLEIGGRIETI